MTDQWERHRDTDVHTDGHVTPPTQPPHPISDSLQNKTPCNSSPVANLLASSSSSSTPYPSPSPAQPCYSCCVACSVCACVAHQTNTDGLAGPLEQKQRKRKGKRWERKEQRAQIPSTHPSPPAWGPHACRSSIRPSPGVKILRLLQYHVCHVPRDHGKVYHRTDRETPRPHTHTHTHTETHRHTDREFLPVRLVRPRSPSVRLSDYPATYLDPVKIFLGLTFLLSLSLWALRYSPPFRGLVTRSSCTHRGNTHTRHQARGLSGPWMLRCPPGPTHARFP